MSGGLRLRPKVAAQRIDVFDDLLFAIAAEVVFAEIAGGKLGVLVVMLPESAPSSSGTRARTPMFFSLAERQELRSGD